MGAKRSRPFFASWRERLFTASSEQVSNNDWYVISVVCVVVCFVRLLMFVLLSVSAAAVRIARPVHGQIYNKRGGATAAGEPTLTCGTCFVASRLALVSVGVLLCFRRPLLWVVNAAGLLFPPSVHCLCTACIGQSCLAYLRTTVVNSVP